MRKYKRRLGWPPHIPDKKIVVEIDGREYRILYSTGLFGLISKMTVDEYISRGDKRRPIFFENGDGKGVIAVDYAIIHRPGVGEYIEARFIQAKWYYGRKVKNSLEKFFKKNGYQNSETA